MSEDIQIIYRAGKPLYIRDKGGILVSFIDIYRYSGQQERYDKEIAEQTAMAEYLLKSLAYYKSCHPKEKEVMGNE